MIETKDLIVGYGEKIILNGICLKVEKGSTITLIGGSGCGKSTLLRAVMGLIPVRSGEIHIDEQRTDNLPAHKMNEIRKMMGMVFQEGALFDSMNVRENVAFSLRKHTKMKEKQIREIVRERLEAVGLEDVEELSTSELSGGMRRRVGIARALALSPGILLYDEPTTGLDPMLTATVTELIIKMKSRYNTTAIVVTHDMQVAEAISDRIYMIHEGNIVAEGDGESLRQSSNPQLRSFLDAMHNISPRGREAN